MSALFTRLLFKMMPKVKGMTSYSDLLLMYDNLDTPLSETYSPEIKNFLNMLPMKINFTVVILCIQGHVEIQCNLKDLSIGKNGLVVIPSGTKAEKLEIHDDSKVVVLVVPDQTFAPPSNFHNSTYASVNFTSPTAVELEPAEVRQGVDIYRLLKAQLQNDEMDVNTDLVKAYILLLAGVAAVGFQRWRVRNKKVKISNKEQIYRDFLHLLSEDYRKHRDVAHYAQCLGLTAKYFASVIFDASGHHPLDLIKEQVIMDAQQLLKNGRTIMEVCETLNFSSQSQFTNYFKSAVGVPPGEFLKNVAKDRDFLPE